MQKTGAKTWTMGAPSAYQLRDITHFPDWKNLIVWDAFFNNLTSGLMLAAAIAYIFGPPPFTWLLPLAMTLALLLVAIDLFLLVADLGDSWRFYHSLRVMRFTSPLSVGVWGLVAYSIFLACAVVLTWLVWFMGPELSGGFIFVKVLARLFTVLAVIGATVVICYKGVVFSCSSQPGVRNARWLTPFMVSDSLLIGLSLYTLLALAFISIPAVFPLVVPLAILIVIRCAAFALLWLDVKNRARIMYPEENKVVCVLVFIIGGLVAFILAFCGVYGLTLSALLALCCGVVERYWIIGLTKPAVLHN